MEQQYYLLSLKWSDGKGNYVWWGPNDSGYTDDLEAAGIYTASQIALQPMYYSNTGVMPVEIDRVHNLRKKVTVPNSFAKELEIHEFLKTAKEY